MRFQHLMIACLLALFTAHLCIGADATIEKSIERAKDKRQQDLDRAGVAFRATVDRANNTLAKLLETAAANTRKKDAARADSLAKLAEAAKAGEAVESDTGDKLLDGAVKRRAADVEQANKVFKAAVARANETMEKSYDLAIAGYKKKSDARADELAKEFGEIKAAEVTPPGPGESVADASARSAPGHVELIKSVGENLVTADGKTVASKQLASQDYVLVYFSAHWCGPCRAFTPDLVKFHNDYSKTGKFEVILVSSDRSEKDMFGYMTEAKMPWLSIPYNNVGASGLSQKHGVIGIPHLALLDKQGNIVSSAVENGQYVGPRKVLADLKAKLGVK